MLRDQQGLIQYEDAGEVEKFYPQYPTDRGIFWTCNRIKVSTTIPGDFDKSIIAFRFLRGPHKIISAEGTGKVYQGSEPKDYPEDVQKVLASLDITCNCFGFVLLDGLAWVDPLLWDIPKNLSVIDNILESDRYKKIEMPVPDSIALFSTKDGYRHASRTSNGNSWFSKHGIRMPGPEKLEDSIKQYGPVTFYKRQQIM